MSALIIWISYFVLIQCEEYIISSIKYIGPKMCEEQCKQMTSCVSFTFRKFDLSCTLHGSYEMRPYCEMNDSSVQGNEECVCSRHQQHIITKNKGSFCSISDCSFSEIEYNHAVGNKSCQNAVPSYCKANGEWDIPNHGNVTWHLTGGSYGLLLVKINNEWGTVCNDLFNITDASVACRSLGYSRGIYQNSHTEVWREGCGPIWLDDVICSGEEDSLLECDHRGIGDHNCGHDEDICLICT